MPEMTGLDDEEADISDQGARDRDTLAREASKDYVDEKFHAKERDVREGELFLLEQKRQNKLSSSFRKEPYEVMTRYGSCVEVVERGGSTEEIYRISNPSTFQTMKGWHHSQSSDLRLQQLHLRQLHKLWHQLR